MDQLILTREIAPVTGNTSVIGVIRSYRNHTYSVSIAKRRVNVRGLDSVYHITISRLDYQPIESRKDFQEIKNQILGPEFTAIEVYPPESQLTDTANCYHLWAHPDPTYRLPFSLNQGRAVVSK